MTSFHPVDISTASFWAQTMRERDVAFTELRGRPGITFCSGKGVGFSDIPAEHNEPFGSFLMTAAPGTRSSGASSAVRSRGFVLEPT